jgi:hypothetical protein
MTTSNCLPGNRWRPVETYNSLTALLLCCRMIKEEFPVGHLSIIMFSKLCRSDLSDAEAVWS